MRYGLIKITDWICYFSDETKKKFECRKKNGRKTAIKFSESARFLPVGRARSNKHLFIFGLSHLTENHLLSDKQYGFRSGRSCSLQLLNVMERWTEYVEQHQSWDTIYLDLAKAFDKVAHQRLPKKISSYGIKAALLSWISSLLLDRRQCVSLKGSSSTWKPIDSGVPQGSVLGPILFIMYVNDIPDIVKSNVWIFADDTKLFTTTDKTITLQEDLDNLIKWGELWELTFNVIKCKVIHYGQNNPESDYIMNDKKLESVDEECDLGVNFTRELKFSQHIAKKVNKANSMLALIKEHLNIWILILS